MAELRAVDRMLRELIKHKEVWRQMLEINCQYVTRYPQDAIQIFIAALRNRGMRVPEKLLERLPGFLSTPPLRMFNPAESFVDMSGIRVTDEFKELVFPIEEKEYLPAESLGLFKLLQNGNDPDIITRAGGDQIVRIALGQFYAVFAYTPNHEKGLLPKNGTLIISYSRHTSLPPLCGRRYKGVWELDVCEIYPRTRFAGSLLLSR